MSLPETLNDREHRSYRQDPGKPNQSLVAVTQVDASTGQSIGISTDFEGGQVTVGLTEVEITFTGTTKSILIQADQDNTDDIYIGKTGVTTSTGMVRLDPGRGVEIELNDTDNPIFAISGTAGQIIHKMAII